MDSQQAKEIVIEFITLINDEHFKEARKYADDGMTFRGVLGSRDGADEYFADMEKMKLKYAVIKTIADGDDVCVFYNLDMSGANIFGCGWYEVREGKIVSLKVIFDPRPVLEKQGKK